MSSNSQLIIKKKKFEWEIYMNSCVDNDFKYNKEDMLKTEPTLKKAILWCNKYLEENVVEYGYIVEGINKGE